MIASDHVCCCELRVRPWLHLIMFVAVDLELGSDCLWSVLIMFVPLHVALHLQRAHFRVHFTFYTIDVVQNVEWTWKCVTSVLLSFTSHVPKKPIPRIDWLDADLLWNSIIRMRHNLRDDTGHSIHQGASFGRQEACTVPCHYAQFCRWSISWSSSSITTNVIVCHNMSFSSVLCQI